ncbi:cytochrome P450 [Aureobasidium melanogenum CBS 110374]|uniref:Cytochrome P450 n=1 Tax=Aureobasidium melanogenum (strain CBS 110374) TaxID=1043003 RepID=A0A074WBJ1_AURM1|nr:cytochrome P450 [Aureobasidium melanogenum CBS 110374]KEQ59861.1 cytochrome P450 [Aureobasidium melanogenum CBS 110374]
MPLLVLSPTLLALSLLSLTLLYLVYRAVFPRPIPGIPYNKDAARSILGDLPEFLKYVKKNNGQAVNWWHMQVEKHDSPIVQLFLNPFGGPTVIVADFREAQDVLLRRSKEFDRSKGFDNVFSGVLPYHHIGQKTTNKVKAQKRLLADTMSASFLNEMHQVAAPRVHESTLDLVRLWSLKADLAKNHPFEAHEDIAHTTLDAIWVVVLGSSADTVATQANMLEALSDMQLPTGRDVPVVFPQAPHPPAFDAVLTLAESVTPLISSPSPKIHHWFLRQSSSYKDAKRYKDQEIETMMKAAIDKFSEDRVDALEKQGKDRSAIDHMIRRELLASRKEGRSPQYDTPAAKDELFGFLIAGHETTATTTAWAVKLLSDNKKAQSKLREVLRSTYTDAASEQRQPTAGEIATLHHPYIDATLEEILRCGGTIAVMSRCAMVDTDVFGIRIPRGTDLNFLTHAGYVAPPVGVVEEHTRSPSSQAAKDKTGIWEVSDINVFKPERWLRPTDKKGEVEFQKNAGPSLQFGAGIRGCFGRRLAYIELRMLIVLIIWNFELLPVPEKLGTYLASDKITHQPQKCYLCLKKAGW